MHEFSIAQSIVDRVLEAAADRGIDVVEGVTIEVGTATHLNPEQLSFAIGVVAEGTIADGLEVEIEAVSPHGSCDCGWEGELEALDGPYAFAPDRTCPRCGERVALTRGDGCRLVRMTVPDGEE